VSAEAGRARASGFVSFVLSAWLVPLAVSTTALAQDAASEAAPSEPGPPSRFYVISIATDDSLEAYAQRAGAAARASVRELPNVEWQAADRLFLSYDDSVLVALDRARAELEAGRAAYLNLELATAIDRLTAAVADFDAAVAALEDPQDLGDALLLLGASLAFEGRPRDAQRVFTRLHVQMPHLRPDADVFSPDIRALFEAARPPDGATARIRVESDPPGAIAYVDFLARGVTPITVEGLYGGDHVIRVTRAGAIPFVQSIAVRPRQSEHTSAFLVDDERTRGLSDAIARVRDEGTASSLAPGGALREIATMLDVERIGVIRVGPGDSGERVALELAVFEVESGRRLVRGAGQVPTGVGDLERGVEQLVAGGLRAAVARTTPVATVVSAPERPEPEVATVSSSVPTSEVSRPIVEEWWFWTLIGGAVVVAGAAIAIGVAASDSGPGLGSDPSPYVVLEF
jgi:hypothetical protein